MAVGHQGHGRGLAVEHIVGARIGGGAHPEQPEAAVVGHRQRGQAGLAAERRLGLAVIGRQLLVLEVAGVAVGGVADPRERPVPFVVDHVGHVVGQGLPYGVRDGLVLEVVDPQRGGVTVVGGAGLHHHIGLVRGPLDRAHHVEVVARGVMLVAHHHGARGEVLVNLLAGAHRLRRAGMDVDLPEADPALAIGAGQKHVGRVAAQAVGQAQALRLGRARSRRLQRHGLGAVAVDRDQGLAGAGGAGLLVVGGRLGRAALRRDGDHDPVVPLPAHGVDAAAVLGGEGDGLLVGGDLDDVDHVAAVAALDQSHVLAAGGDLGAMGGGGREEGLYWKGRRV